MYSAVTLSCSTLDFIQFLFLDRGYFLEQNLKMKVKIIVGYHPPVRFNPLNAPN
jgi:hypothetical protein